HFMAWFVSIFDVVFKAIAWILQWPIAGAQVFLQWLPWPVTICVVAVIAHFASGWRLAAFSVAVMLSIVIVRFWAESMNSMSLVLISIPHAVIIGFFVAVAAFRWPAAERLILPTLAFLQTVPAFA